MIRRAGLVAESVEARVTDVEAGGSISDEANEHVDFLNFLALIDSYHSVSEWS